MPIAVLDIELTAPLRHKLKFANVIADLGDGYEIRLNKNQAYTRADGQGGNTSYKGRNEFTINTLPMAHVNNDPSQQANKLWAFYVARLAGFEAFYFYNPAERSTPDLTGIDIIGRYLVRFRDPELEREQFMMKLYRAGLSLIEVRA